MKNDELGEWGAWTRRNMKSEGCGKCEVYKWGVWKIRRVENEKCGKMKSLENMECGNEDSGKSVE